MKNLNPHSFTLPNGQYWPTGLPLCSDEVFVMSKSKFYFIYKTTCIPTGLIYVGQHAADTLDDKYLGGGPFLKKEIKKYNKKNFKREILEVCQEEDVDQREKFWQIKLDCTNPNIGYNKRISSAKGKRGRIVSEETLIKMSKPRPDITGDKNFWFGKDRKGEKNPHWGFKHSIESKKKIRDNRTYFSGEDNVNWGRKASIETCSKMSDAIENRKELQCPYCDVKSKVYSNMYRWHFDNCSQKPK